MATMRAIVFEGPAQYGPKIVAKPELKRPDDVLIRVQAAGICGTDVHIVEPGSTFPTVPGTILGHEYTGVVEDAGDDVGDLKKGDRVVVEPNIPCLTCVYCRMAMPNQCENLILTGLNSHGGWADFNVMPARMLHKVPEDMPVELAALAEPLSCVLGGTEKVLIRPGETVVILGAGPIGLLYLQVFKSSGARQMIVVEPHAGRADVARTMGATKVINPREEDSAEVVRAETRIGADVVVDTVGNQLGNALKLVRRRGTVLLFGLISGASTAVEQFDLTFKEIRIQGTLIGTYNMGKTLSMLQQGIVDPNVIVSHHLGLGEAETAINELRAGRATKVLLYPDR
jgi:(R,R)-butanediol dehydrogenase / meso-butanediol dehydrogenase / diacetyl reductase